MPRPLSSRERTALDALLRGEFDGFQEFRLQAGLLAEGDGLIIERVVVDDGLPAAQGAAIVLPSRRVFMTVTTWVASFSSSRRTAVGS